MAAVKRNQSDLEAGVEDVLEPPAAEKPTGGEAKLISRGRIEGLRGKKDVIQPGERFAISGIDPKEIDRLLSLDAVYAPNEAARIVLPNGTPRIMKDE